MSRSRRNMKASKAFKEEHNAEYTVDIGQEFKEVKQSIQALRTDLNEWKSIFNSQLDKLNTNMEKVMDTIANHEARLTNLETQSLKAETKKETISEMSKFAIFAAKILFAAGAIVGSIVGLGGCFKWLF